MTAYQLQEEITELSDSDAPHLMRLTAALRLLKRAHTALEDTEGKLQDAREELPDDYCRGVLDALSDMPADDIGPFLEAGKLAAAEKHGFHSAEYESMDMLTSAITNT